jgi:hypothetical protein
MAKKVKKHSSQKPNIGAEHLEKPNSRLSSQHKLEMARRRSRVAELASEGLSVRSAEEILRSEGFKRCDHVTIAADLKLERDRLAAATRATTVQHRQKVLEKLTQMEAFVRARGWDDPNYVGDLLGIIDRVIKLLGLSQERHQINVAVANDTIPAEKMIGWRRWLRETQFISESEFQPIWDLCRKLSKPPTAETTAMIGPPADSPLWHDDKEAEN